MPNPFDQFDAPVSQISKSSLTQVKPNDQRLRDLEGLEIVKRERTNANLADRVFLDREIARRSSALGLPIDYSTQPIIKLEDTPAGVSTPASAPVDNKGNPIQTAIRGFGQQATLGLIQYPQAALKSLITGQPYSESLSNLRQENRQLATTEPKAWTGGSVLGSAVPMLISGGSSLPSQIASGAVQGGISGYTQNDNINEAASGAGLGAAFGTAGGLLGRLWKSPWQKEIDQIKKLEQSAAASFVPGAAEDLASASKQLDSNKAFQTFLGQKYPVTKPSIPGMIKETSKEILPFAWQATKDIGPAAVVGGIGGAGAYTLSGQDPTAGFLTGAALGATGVKKELSRQALSSLTKNAYQTGAAARMYKPNLGYETAGRLSQLGARSAPQVINPNKDTSPVSVKSQSNPFDQFD